MNKLNRFKMAYNDCNVCDYFYSIWNEYRRQNNLIIYYFVIGRYLIISKGLDSVFNEIAESPSRLPFE